MAHNYLVLSQVELATYSDCDDFAGADESATKYVRSEKLPQYVYKLHKVYRPAFEKNDPEIVYVDP